MTSKGASSGNAFISGLPGTIDGTDEFPCSSLVYGLSGITGVNSTQGTIQVSSNIINLTVNEIVSNNPLLTAANFSNTSEIYGNGLYFLV